MTCPNCQHSAAAIRAAADRIDALDAQLTALTPRWHDGDPPADTLVFRDDDLDPVWTLTDDERANYEGTEALYWHHMDGAVPWGTARWCPVVRPS